jgi:exonuclease SbcD
VSRVIRILLLADTHLGFDLPLNPRVNRRRRGHDFLANYATALGPARAGDVDLVVHCGDVFNRSRPPDSVGWQAFEPLRNVAERGIPVFIVPGNHERGRLPHMRFAQHPGIFVFDQPRTFVHEAKGVRVAVSGFPSERDDVRNRFADLVAATSYAAGDADVRLLCLHQCVEGATVGPANYMFTNAPDVIRCSELLEWFAAVLSGHIHRHQVLTTDRLGRPLPAPVLYPGSIERTSIAEAEEEKGFMVVELDCGDATRLTWQFRKLPSRPLVRHDLPVHGLDGSQVESALRSFVETAPADAVVSVRVSGPITEPISTVLSAAFLRSLTPPTMNLDLRIADQVNRAAKPRSRTPNDEILELPL